MKTLIILFIISFSATAGFYSAPFTEIEKKLLDCDYSITVFKKCEGYCAEITKDFNCNYSEIYEELVDDKSKPVYSKSEIEACEDQSDCESKNLTKSCLDVEEYVLMSDGYSEIYCSKLLRYEQKKSGIKTIVVNEIKRDAYESLKLEKETQEAAIKMAMKAINHGQRVIALLIVRNASKGLTTAQIGEMNLTYAQIKGLLETGSLLTAKEKIELITPDGTIVTEADKTALVSEINKFLGL